MRTFQRGFFCADLEIRYPYRECTISVPMLLLCMLLLPMLFISVVEIMRVCKAFRFRKYGQNLWRSLGNFSAGFIATYLTTELAKNVVGRLRPHFYSACEPHLSDGTTCEDIRNHGAFVTQYYCANRLLSAAQLRELHVSFPSAHASLSFYSMLFLSFYLHAVWRRGRGWCRVLRHILQFLLLLVAWYISLSRVADYWHHWSDVLGGALLGVAYAIITAIYVGGLLSANALSLGGVGGSGVSASVAGVGGGIATLHMQHALASASVSGKNKRHAMQAAAAAAAAAAANSTMPQSKELLMQPLTSSMQPLTNAQQANDIDWKMQC